jgi:anti-sigma B factor antagonist
MVAIFESTVVVKISGRATFNASADFKTLFQELRNRGYDCFALDLSECLVMDSTFLGVLAGLGQKISNGPSANGKIRLLAPNQRVNDLLENLGVIHLFTVVHRAPVNPPGYQPVTPQSEPTREEVTRTCLEAHRTLMAINPENAAKFKDVTRFLAEDLERIQSSTPR